jgi:thymidine kinase
MSGKITLIVGPMYSGKTSELLSLVEIYDLGKKSFLVFKPSIDTRYSEDHIVTHTGSKVKAISVENSSDIERKLDHFEKPLQGVFIDEVNFFDEGLIDVVKRTIQKGINVFCAGLDMSFKYRPFATTVGLMGIADEVKKRKAVCSVCGEYNAVLSHRIKENGESEIDIGGFEKYVAVCRDCYEKLNGI